VLDRYALLDEFQRAVPQGECLFLRDRKHVPWCWESRKKGASDSG
jgi:hypothetical protein